MSGASLSTFTFNITDHRVRTVTIDGEPWFVAKDVAEVLGFTTTASASWYTRHVGADQTRMVKRSNITGGDTGSFPNRGALCVSERGLYRLIMRSNKPEAERFQDWVCGEVLPAIRKDGGYIMAEEKVRTGEMSEDELLHRVLEGLNRKVERRRREKVENQASEVQIDEKTFVR